MEALTRIRKNVSGLVLGGRILTEGEILFVKFPDGSEQRLELHVSGEEFFVLVPFNGLSAKVNLDGLQAERESFRLTKPPVCSIAL